MEGETCGLQLVDEKTGYRAFYPDSSRVTERNILHIRHFRGDDVVQHSYSDDAKEITNAFEAEGALPRVGTPHRPTSRAKIEVQVKLTVEGGRATLAQSGFDHKFAWRAAEFWNRAQNVSRRSADGKTAWQRRTGQEFHGLLIPYVQMAGCLVHK